jgi:hypothetical protein
VAVMHNQYSDYLNSLYPQTVEKKKPKTGLAMISVICLFMLFGFMAGIGLLLIRNSYLFS